MDLPPLPALHPATACVGFVLFRIIDIVKPWPARDFEALPDGLGIMADDVMAGIYANLVLRIALLVRALRLMRAEILAVGSELLTPLRSDTNALWITDRLARRRGRGGSAGHGGRRSALLESAFRTALGPGRSRDRHRRARARPKTT